MTTRHFQLLSLIVGLSSGLSVVTGCASVSPPYGRLTGASADECEVVAALLRNLPPQATRLPDGYRVTLLSVAPGSIELSSSATRVSAEVTTDLRAKFGHAARLDGCAQVKSFAANAGWRFAPRVSHNMGDMDSYRGVSRVGLNADRTEAVLRETTGGSYGEGRFAWFDVRTFQFRKDPTTGHWKQVALLEEVVT